MLGGVSSVDGRLSAVPEESMQCRFQELDLCIKRYFCCESQQVGNAGAGEPQDCALERTGSSVALAASLRGLPTKVSVPGRREPPPQAEHCGIPCPWRTWISSSPRCCPDRYKFDRSTSLRDRRCAPPTRPAASPSQVGACRSPGVSQPHACVDS
ncbi:6176_t:CDS:2 [Scutellospora calospora]|uniref:6176_t:CDS:1 n=1 Tax=Scutellospora calospora TaxID=85575 RepID=A0ACA9L3X9_9GLOM|nr:6176_t:CDS:2 [Scutellospora calospora]